MKPVKVVHQNGSVHLKEQKKKQIQKAVLAIVLSLVVIGAAFFTVYAVSRGIAESSAADKNVQLDSDNTIDATLARGDICTLTLPEGVDVNDVTFSTSDAKIVRVDAAGRVDGLAEGSATVTAKAGDFSASCRFTVEQARGAKRTSEITTAYLANLDTLYEKKKKSRDNLYRITVNRRTNTVTIYTYDESGDYNVPVRAMVCSCGQGGSNITPVGEYRVASKREWATLYGDAAHEYLFGQYVTEFNGEYLFHSVPYESQEKYALEIDEYNKLGASVSQGCVRLSASDSYWIYKNCSLNTPVRVIDADGSADPLGTPPAVRQNIYNGWDPTDPDEENPFQGKRPRILNIEDVTLKKGSAFDPMEGVAAKDICGNIITDRVLVQGKVLTDKPGTYYLTYSITDDFHLTRSATRTVVVK